MIRTDFRIYDLSDIPSLLTAQEEDNSPVILAAYPTAKGTEKLSIFSGTDFVNMVGMSDYEKYGQISEQTQRAVANGAKVAFKRLVATDATLANVVVVAEVYQTKVQKKNASNALLYLDENGELTTESTHLGPVPEGGGNAPVVNNEPAYDYTGNVRYVYKTIADSTDFTAVKTAGALLLDSTGVDRNIGTTAAPVTVKVFSYPLFTVSDNGRGLSNKRWYVEPQKQLSKNLNFMFYTLNIVEDGTVTESAKFSVVPGTKYKGEDFSLSVQGRKSLIQVQAHSFDSSIIAFTDKLAALSLVDREVLTQNDILNGSLRKGTPLAGIAIDTVEGLLLNTSTGFNLSSGSNGAFGDAPYKSSTTKALVDTAMLKFYNGELTPDIYDVDNFQLDLCFDANFTVPVKEAITVLAEWRKDFMFFRDYGTEIYSFDDIVEKHELLTPSMYVTDYCQAYDVMSPYTSRINTVTITYSLSAMIVNHMVKHHHVPFAGKRYNAVITDIIPDTLRYAARIIPGRDEKEELETLKVNFASFFQYQLVVESIWTSQSNYTQLSFSNNVIALQKVLKALRVKFPALRYAFITKKEDLEAYEKEVNDVLSLYSANFVELSYEYIDDATYRANKIFRAKLSFRFNDFVQAELIDVYALPTEDIL